MATAAVNIWDMVCVTAAGFVCISAYSSVLSPLFHGAIPPDALNGGAWFNNARTLSLLGGLLAPLMLRTSPHGFGAPDMEDRLSPAMAWGITKRVLLLFGSLLAVVFLTRNEAEVPRLWVVLWAVTTLALTLAGRAMILAQLRLLEARGVLRERVAIIGSGRDAYRLAAHLTQGQGRGVDMVGIFEDGPADAMPHERSCAALLEFGKQNRLDWVVIAGPDLDADRLDRLVYQLRALDIKVALCPPGLELSSVKPALGQFRAIPVMLLENRPIRSWGLFVKECLDKTVSALAILALSPLLAAVALAIKLDSPGPVIFKQKRHGRNNAEFWVFKFRTMRVAAPDASDGRFQTQRSDKRITRLGAFLRASSLDELPQLFNVVLGDMSLVGPRPHPCEMRTENLLSSDITPDYAHRHRVKPGITGWAQINGHRGATDTAEQVKQRVRYDLYYIQNWSVLLDLKILMITPLKLIFNRQNAF